VTTPGIPNDYTLSTTCFGTRLGAIHDQVFAAVGMGFRRIELGLVESPAVMDGLDDAQRETGIKIRSMMVGCCDSLNGSLAFQHLGSPDPEERERAMNAVRRHARLAQSWKCPVLVVRGAEVDSAELRRGARDLEQRLAALTISDDPTNIRTELQAFVVRVQREGQRQIEQFCRSLFDLCLEHPEVTFVIEPGHYIDDLLGFEAMGWVLDDLESVRVGYWHDVGRIHLRQAQGLPGQGAWLDAYAGRMQGIHLQDACASRAELPIGLGEVDFKLLSEYVPKNAERVVEIGPCHGRAEILGSVRFLVDMGF